MALTSGFRVRSCCPRAWAPEEALARATPAFRPSWFCSVGSGLPSPVSLTCAWPELASQGTKGTQARELLGAERRAPAFRLSATLSPERARSLRLLPAPQGPPLGDAARAPPRGGGSANKLGSSSGRALRSLLRAASPGTVCRAHTGPSETELLAAAPGSRAAVP